MAGCSSATAPPAAETQSSARAAKSAEELEEYLRSREVVCSMDRRHNCSIIVDGFCYTVQILRHRDDAVAALDASIASPLAAASPALGGARRHRAFFILSHFHSDHYVGLNPGWSHGKIYCSPVTAALLVKQLRVRPENVVALDLNRPYKFNLASCEVEGLSGGRSSKADDSPQPIRPPSCAHHSGDEGGCDLISDVGEDDVVVTFVDANHCPGAVITVVQGRVGGTRVHTGDFRYNGTKAYWAQKHHHHVAPFLPTRFGNFLGDDPVLKHVAGKVDVLFLDNTFCDPAFDFKPQPYAFQQALAHINNSIHRCVVEKLVGGGPSSTSPSTVVFEGGIAKSDGSPAARLSTSADVGAGVVVSVAVLVGTYTIGKERVAIALRDLLGLERTPIFVSSQKHSVLQCAGFDSERDFSCLSSADVTLECRRGDSHFAVLTEEGISRISARVAPNPALTAQLLALNVEPRKVEIRLTFFLVPLSTLSYTHLAEAMGGSKRRNVVNNDGTEATSSGGGGKSKADCAAEAAAAIATGVVVGLDSSSAVTSDDLTADSGTADGADAQVQGGEPHVLELWDDLGVVVEHFDAIVGLEPTGWVSNRSPSRTEKRVGPRIRVFTIPYSEHSSYSELLAFVRLVKPLRVVPTVSVKTFTKWESTFVEQCPRLRSRLSNVQPLAAFKHLFRKVGPEEIFKQRKQSNPFCQRAHETGVVHKAQQSVASASALPSRSGRLEQRPAVAETECVEISSEDDDSKAGSESGREDSQGVIIL